MLRFIKVLPTATLVTTGLTATVLSLALGRVHIRAQTTLIGYKIGHLKVQEGKLLEERSTLKMQLAKMTTQKHLTLMTDMTAPAGAAEGTYALK